MGLLVQTQAQARRLSHTLRTEQTPFLRARRRVAALALTAIGSMGAVTLYQFGLIRRLPDLPLPHFDAEKVDASPQAYRYGSMPDGAAGLASYAVTLALAATGSSDRHRTHAWLPLALTAKAGVDAAVAAKLTVDQWTRHRAFCSWCLVAAGATFAALPLTLPEARAALRRLRKG